MGGFAPGIDGNDTRVTGERETLRIRPDPVELSRMREFIRRRAAQHGLDAAAMFQAQLVATEAVTNAMRHGRRDGGADDPITITCAWLEDGLTIEVGDRGRFRHREASTPEDTSGRGLGLIGRLTRGFDLETSERGTKLRMLVGGAA
jgi:anti-sigma regulatory factor (Ser/Thr protein kinase)